MTGKALSRTLHERQIKTVLNLRGSNPEESWYRDEAAATLAAGVTQVDFSLSSCIWMSRLQLKTLVRVLDACEYPLIVHCAWGSERTGVASAIIELLRPGSTLKDARDQLGLDHLYVRWGDGKIMAEFLDQYEQWLRRAGLTHTPEVFRQWVAEGYTPEKPSREDWPFDPAPLVVITRPERPLKDSDGKQVGQMPPEGRTR